MLPSVCLLLAVWIVSDGGGGGWSVGALEDPRLQSELFYPFGPEEGDRTVLPNDDGSSEAVIPTTSFPFFNTTNTRLFVNTNGAVSFGTPVSSFTPTAFPLAFRIIAPYWCDVDTNRNPGRVFYRESTDPVLLNRATEDALLIYSTKGLHSFKANWIFIATWYNVTYFGGSTTTPVNTFQAVLLTDGKYSFAIFNYGPMTWTTGTASGGDRLTGLGGTPAQVGFNAGDAINFFAVNDSRTANIVHIGEHTNTGQRGRWLFRVDSATIEDGDCFKPGPDGCRQYQTYDSSAGKCIDIAPEFGCPSIEGPVVIQRSWFEFYCAIPTKSSDARSKFNVTFLFDGIPDPNVPQFNVTAAEGNATLHEKYLKGHLGKWISCNVSSFWDTDGSLPVFSQALSSVNSYWAGIQPSTKELYVTEGIRLDPSLLLLKSTLPITCTSYELVTGVPSNCFLPLQIITTDSIMIRQNGTVGCDYTLTELDWKANEKKAYNPNNPIEIYTKSDPFTTAPRPNNFTVRVKLRRPKKYSPSGDEYDDPWDGYVVETIWVYHVDMPVASCHASGDPNLVTFDKVQYATYASGQFTYIQTTRGIPVEVQVRHRPCGQTVSCVCGVAVREGSLILAADMCVDLKLRYVTYNDVMPNGAAIKVSSNGATFEIKTPGGIKVLGYLRSWGMNIAIHVTASDYGRVEGLCGSFDGLASNDLKIKDTDNYLPLPPNPASLMSFIESWSIPLGQSLFDGYLSNLTTGRKDVLDLNEICSCRVNGPSCGVSVATNPNDPASSVPIPGDNVPIRGPEPPILNPNLILPHKRNSTSFVYDGRSFNISFIPGAIPGMQWPTTGNFTELQAFTHCSDILWNNISLPQICVDKMKKSDIDGVINKCVSDIKMTDDLSWADDKVFEIQSMCINNILTDNTTSVRDAVELASKFAATVCVPHDCSNHGTCTNGTCACDPDFIGIDCATPKETIPEIIEIPYPVCDVRTEKCEAIRIVTRGVAPGPKLTCKVDVTRWDGSKKPYLLRGYVETPDTTICPLPMDQLQRSFIGKMPNITATTFTALPMGSPVLHFDISLSNDRSSFGNDQSLEVIDSRCISCQDLHCTPKDDACIIRGYCFVNGEGNPYNPTCEKCDVTHNTTNWLRNPNCSHCDAPPCSGEGAMGVYRTEPEHGLTSPLNLTEVLANRLNRYRTLTLNYVTRVNLPQNFYTEVCAGMLPETSAQLRIASLVAYPYVTFDWVSGMHDGVDSGCRGAVIVAATRTYISISQRLGGVYSSPDQRETGWSMFSVTDTMLYDTQLLCVYGSNSVSNPGPLPMYNPTVVPVISPSGEILYNEKTTAYSCRANTAAYFFSISVGVPAGKMATVHLLLSGLDQTFEITRWNSNTNGTTTLARSILVPCTDEAQLSLIAGEVEKSYKLISFTAFPYAIRNGPSVSWAGYRTSELTDTGTVIYDRWLVMQAVKFVTVNSVIQIPSSGYYYVYLSAGVHPGQGLSMSLMSNDEVLFGLTRTSTNHNGVDTIGHGMVVLLNASDVLRVESKTTAYSTSIGLHTSFLGMLLYHE